MKPKIVSDAQITANRKNAAKSTGPKTPRGKSYSRHNALTHGLYSRDLALSEADRPEYIELRHQLKAQFKPATPMQEIAFDGIAICSWRCKRFMRLEDILLERQLRNNNQPQAEDTDANITSHLSRWYGSSRHEIRAGIKALAFASDEFSRSGYLSENTKDFLIRGFGVEFMEILNRWTPMSKDAILLAHHVVEHRKEFGDPAGANPDLRSSPNVTVVEDPMQKAEMVVKLIDERRHFLEELLKLMNQDHAFAESRESSDFNPPFLPASQRELRKAVDWFLHVKEVGL